MITIPGYRITQQLYSGSRTQVYRGISESNQQPVVIKLLKNEYPTFHELVQFRNQYTIAKNLALPGVVKHLSLENYGNGFALVMEDNGCVSLAEYSAPEGAVTLGETEAQCGNESQHSDDTLCVGVKGGSPNSSLLPLDKFLHVSIQIVQTLEGLYHNRIIHKDIKPHNILINPETNQVKLIDFSISSLLPRENQEIANPNVLEGTLAYMSPEQTGRMNRGIDYRTDYYSLGVTFYELLTGQLPFQSTDPLELVHCHIARMPTPPIQINPAIPQVLNDIVMKLMAKTAEERYQTAFGLRYDLERCLEQYSSQGSITPFQLGELDICDRFVIPEKLYGRETEVATLLAAFERVSAGSTEIMLVAGFSGIGKTAVVNEIHKPIVRQRGYFIKGKFDQFKRDIPFSGWVQAFQNLMQQLLSESAASVQKWKTKISEALGENGQVIIDVIPELELLIGKQPKVPELDGSAAQNRFNLLFEKFIRIFATQEHPLVIFLDDLQWTDSASLKLMQLLLSESQRRYLLLIGAYRDNEVFPTHPFILMLDEIRKARATVNQITLAPLNQASLNCLIADTLCCPLQRAVPLTELVFTKTKGNPFFATQFLKSLHEDGLISFNPPQSSLSKEGSQGGWQCDITQVRAMTLTMGINALPEAKTEQLSQTYHVYRAGTHRLYPTNELPIVRSLHGERVKVDDLELHQPNKIIPVEISTTPIFDETGKIVYAIAAFQDITSRKQAEKLIAEYSRTLEEQVKERTAQLALANQEIMALNERLKAENLRMSAELEVTRKLQQMILPKPEELESIEGLEIAGFMEPADEVGGDYYDVLQQDGKVKIGIGDVTGHGLESGMLMLMTQTAVRTLQESNQTDPVQFFDILNRTIYRNVQRINPAKNLTLALLDYHNGTLSLSGQHEEMIVVRAGGEFERIDTVNLGFPIGLDEEIADFIASVQVQLNQGDVVVLYTDGITEAFDINRQQYGLERLCEIVSLNWERKAQEIRQAVIEDVRQHIGEQKVFDDITLVVLKQK